MKEIQGKSILVRVRARFELAGVRVIGSRLYNFLFGKLQLLSCNQSFNHTYNFLNLDRLAGTIIYHQFYQVITDSNTVFLFVFFFCKPYLAQEHQTFRF